MAGKSSTKGFVYLIGAGPGDPGLITVRGRECIARSEVILYDYLANEEFLRYAPAGAELIYAGKIGGAHNREQRQINELLVQKAATGKVVARLKGGDPFVFGRGGEECEALVDAGIPFEIVPGVTAGIGAAAYAGIPLTHRDFTTSVAFVTGHEGHDKDVSTIDWEQLSIGSGTIVFYMGVKNLPQIVANLVAHGRSPETPVALVRWGTRPEQEVLTATLADIVEKAKRCFFKAPAITVVGEVVTLREKLRWFDNRPLFGRTVLVTRAADQASDFTILLQEMGARVMECPTIRIAAPESFAELDSDIGRLGEFDWIVFSSANAVNAFFDRLHLKGKDSRAIAGCKVACVGPKTAEMVAVHGIKADMIPADYKGEGLVAAFSEEKITGKRVLFPKGDRARDVIPGGLQKQGNTVAAPVAYRNLPVDEVPSHVMTALEEGEIDCVTFTASSTVTNLADLLGENRFLKLMEGIAVAAIGPITSRTCREFGLEVKIEPAEYTLAAMVEEIVQYFGKKK
jgi:uroporphyrinogen III methyltransferase/synthase